jgi:4-hydroxybenzoate polyprenyltransferase
MMMKTIKHLEINKYLRLIRLDKPIPILLLLFPILWTIILGARSLSMALLYLPVFILGAFFMRSAGCIINDLWDAKIDGQVERTKTRPLASNEIARKDAYTSLSILLGLSFLLLLTLPIRAIIIGLIAIIPIAVYPYMKRITYYPQVFLGLTWNLGVFIAWYTFNDKRLYLAFLIYIAAALWTIGYDTIYAIQDIEDDKAIDVKSTAIALGEKAPIFVWNIYKIMMLILGIVGLNSNMNMLFYLLWGLAIYQLHWQYRSIDLQDPKKCLQLFNSNLSTGTILLLACLVGKL